MTPLRCWPGCLARVVDHTVREANRGLLVKVIDQSDVGTVIMGEFCWTVEPIGRPAMAAAGPTDRGFIGDRWMVPLTPRVDAPGIREHSNVGVPA